MIVPVYSNDVPNLDNKFLTKYGFRQTFDISYTFNNFHNLCKGTNNSSLFYMLINYLLIYKNYDAYFNVIK